jgi:DNA replication protein DnaC
MAGRVERIQPACPVGVCDGGGWVIGDDEMARACECRERRIAQARMRGVRSVLPAKYQGVSFDRPPLAEMARSPRSRAVVERVRGYLDELGTNLSDGRGLWLTGDVGTGKTTLAMLVSKTAIEAGHSVAIYSLPRLLARIRRTYDDAAGELSYLDYFKRLTSVDLLHIDDLGAEKRSDWVLEQLYALVDERYVSNRAMLVTTNLDVAALEEQIGPRTVSRLVEICGDPLPLFGEDQRYRVA